MSLSEILKLSGAVHLKAPVCLIVEYQNTLQRLCTTSALGVGADSPEVATATSSVKKSDTVKLALRSMLRSFSFCAAWMIRVGRLHAFLAKHCTEYAKTCLAVHPPTMLKLSALDNPDDISRPVYAVEGLRNLLIAADGSVESLLFSYLFFNILSVFLSTRFLSYQHIFHAFQPNVVLGPQQFSKDTSEVRYFSAVLRL